MQDINTNLDTKCSFKKRIRDENIAARIPDAEVKITAIKYVQHVYKLHTQIANRLHFLKSAILQMLKKKKKKIIKCTVNTGPVMFSGEIYYTDPLIQLTKSLVKTNRFSSHNYCATNAVAVMYSSPAAS